MGHRHCRVLESTVPRAKGGSASSDYFTLEHQPAHHRLRVASRSDRRPMMVLYEQAQQILQLRVDAFGMEQDKAMQAAASFLTGIAEEYASGKLDKMELKARRYELMKECMVKQEDTKYTKNSHQAHQETGPEHRRTGEHRLLTKKPVT